MKSAILLFLSFLFFYSEAQNLVPNPSFEDTISCPTNINQLSKAKFWLNPTQCSPDYYNACSTANFNAAGVPNNAWGNQMAHAGVAYSGFYAFSKANPNDSREYIQTQLVSQLVNGHKYLVSFFLNLSDGSDYSLSSVGAYFSTNSITGPNCLILNYTPQIQNKSSNQLTDKVNWMLVEDTLLASGTEQYLTIGNFNLDNASDTIYHGFSSGANLSYYYIDDVSVIDVQDLGINEATSIGLKIFPNPANSILNIEARLPNAEIKILDLMGNELYCDNFAYKKQVDISGLANGVYFLQLKEKEKISISKFVKE